ncbi:transposase [Aliivibrio kagoshimensis]|uniref:transposase n=1 Tax=Aliivibrio kagoshimensis TaxID=2910230 RepID=UPI003D0BCEAD
MSENYIQLNDLLVPIGNEQLFIDAPYVVIFIDAQTDRVFAMNMQLNRKPIQLSYRSLLSSLKSGDIKKGILELPEYMLQSDIFVSPQQFEKRDNKFSTIQPIIRNLEQFLVSRSYGSNLIEQCLNVANTLNLTANRTQVYNWLYRYFRAGCNINAFLRKPGTGRVSNKNYAKKTGPKRRSGTVGRMRNSKDEKNIRSIANKHVKCKTPKSFRNAFIEYEDRFASDPVVNAMTGEITGYQRISEDKRLSEHQFTAYLAGYINNNREAFTEAQGKTDKVNKDQKGLKGNVEEFYAEGPGHVYQIDETPLSIELVDEFDTTRTKRMGRPTCYSVIDMFSRAWVGLILTFSKASAHTAREVIFVAFRNKEKFCDEIGVKLSEAWGVHGKCRIIIVDNAEFKAELERALSKDAQIEQVYNTEGNSQQKGLVERRHKSLEDFLFGLVPGVGKKNIADYLKRHLRKDALINIRELYQILIDFITRYNNYYPLEGLPISKEMRRDGVKQIPMNKFEWGLRNRPGYLKPVDENELYLSLLEVGEITAHRSYLFLPGRFINRRGKANSSKGLKYACKWTQENGIQDIKTGRKALPRLPCRFMRYSMSKIFIETPDGLKVATLCAEDNLLTEMSDESITYQKNEQTVQNNQLKEIHDEKQSETRISAQNIVDSAKYQQQKINANQANSQDISANREDAIEVEIVASQRQFNRATGGDTDNQTEPSAVSTDESEEVASDGFSNNTTSALFAAKRAANKKKRGK